MTLALSMMLSFMVSGVFAAEQTISTKIIFTDTNGGEITEQVSSGTAFYAKLVTEEERNVNSLQMAWTMLKADATFNEYQTGTYVGSEVTYKDNKSVEYKEASGFSSFIATTSGDLTRQMLKFGWTGGSDSAGWIPANAIAVGKLTANRELSLADLSKLITVERLNLTQAAVYGEQDTQSLIAYGTEGGEKYTVTNHVCPYVTAEAVSEQPALYPNSTRESVKDALDIVAKKPNGYDDTVAGVYLDASCEQEIDGNSNKLTAGTQTVYVKSNSGIVTTATLAASERTLTSITVSGSSGPSGLVTGGTVTNEQLKDGISVTGHYSDNTEGPISDFTVLVDGSEWNDSTKLVASEHNKKSVTVSAGGKTSNEVYQLSVGKGTLTAENFTCTAPSDLTYSGFAKEATVMQRTETVGTVGDITIKYYEGNAEVNPVNVGTYTVKVAVAASDDWNALDETEVGTFGISTATPTVTAPTMDKTTWKYGEAAGTPEGSAASIGGESVNGSISYQYNTSANADTWDGWNTEVPTAVGSYVVRAVLAEDTGRNWDVTYSPATSFSITKADAPRDGTQTETIYYGKTGSTTVTISNTGWSDLISGDWKVASVTKNSGSNTISASAAGSDKTVTVSLGSGAASGQSAVFDVVITNANTENFTVALTVKLVDLQFTGGALAATTTAENLVYDAATASNVLTASIPTKVTEGGTDLNATKANYKVELTGGGNTYTLNFSDNNTLTGDNTELDAGTYAATLYYRDDTREIAVISNVTVKVEPKTLAVDNFTPDFSITKEYDGGTQMKNSAGDGNASATSNVLGDATITVSANYDDKTVGDNKSYTVTVTAISGGNSANYKLPDSGLTIVSGDDGAITAKEVTVNWTNVEKNYNGAAQTPGASLAGVLSGDTVNVAVSNNAGNADMKAVGDYTAKATLTGNDAGNYTIASADTHAFTITRKTLTVSGWSPSAGSVSYDGSPKAFTLTLSGMANEEQQPALTYKYVGTGGTTYAENTTAPTDAGTYKVTATLTNDNGNYTLASAATKDFTIGKRTVTAVWSNADNSVYDGNTRSMPSATFKKWSSGTEESTATGSLTVTLTSPADGTFRDAGSYTFTAALTEGDAKNYVLASAGKTVTINPFVLVPSLATGALNEILAPTRQYDGTTAVTYADDKSATDLAGVTVTLTAKDTTATIPTPAPTAKVTGVVFTDKRIGEDKTVNVAVALDPANTNYTLEPATISNFATTADIEGAAREIKVEPATLVLMPDALTKELTVTYSDLDYDAETGTNLLKSETNNANVLVTVPESISFDDATGTVTAIYKVTAAADGNSTLTFSITDDGSGNYADTTEEETAQVTAIKDPLADVTAKEPDKDDNQLAVSVEGDKIKVSGFVDDPEKGATVTATLNSKLPDGWTAEQSEDGKTLTIQNEDGSWKQTYSIDTEGLVLAPSVALATEVALEEASNKGVDEVFTEGNGIGKISVGGTPAQEDGNGTENKGLETAASEAIAKAAEDAKKKSSSDADIKVTLEVKVTPPTGFTTLEDLGEAIKLAIDVIIETTVDNGTPTTTKVPELSAPIQFSAVMPTGFTPNFARNDHKVNGKTVSEYIPVTMSGDTASWKQSRFSDTYLVEDKRTLTIDYGNGNVVTYTPADIGKALLPEQAGKTLNVTIGGESYGGTLTEDMLNNLNNLNGTVNGIYSYTASSNNNNTDGGYYIPYNPGPSTTTPAPTYSVNLGRGVSNGKATFSVSAAKAGETVTVTATPDNGYELTGLRVLDAGGREIPVTVGADGRYSFTMPDSYVSVYPVFTATTSAPVTPGVNFIDVKRGSFYEDAVAWAVANGITTSKDSTVTFKPYDSCTRAEAVTFLYRAAGSPEVTTSAMFSDVPANACYAKAVAWAVANGITMGKDSSTTFKPNDVCTRAEIVTFLARFEKAATTDGTTLFTDVAVNDWFAPAVNWAVRNGITKGTSAATFDPYGVCTRAQIVTFLYRDLANK